jgi:spore coat polysaccharide biosynthesis protein SpsF
MRTVAIIQARLGSSRLPGKALADICGKPMLLRVVERVQRCKTVDAVVVAVPDTAEDEPLLKFCESHRISFFRGPEADVLARYHGAALAYDAEAIVRVTSDCPLVEPHVIDAVVEMFREGEVDYCCNNLKPSWPHGLDCELFSKAALLRAQRETRDPYWREHVTEAFRCQPAVYRLANLECPEDMSRYRVTVDWPEDLELVRELYKALGDKRSPGTYAPKALVYPCWADVQWLIERRPELQRLMEAARVRGKFREEVKPCA